MRGNGLMKAPAFVRVISFLLLAGAAAPAKTVPEDTATTPKPTVGAADSAGAPAAGVPSEEQKRQELGALRETMERALNAMDLETILAHVTDDVIFTTMNGDVARNKDGVRKYFETMMMGPAKRIEKVTTKFEVDEKSRFLAPDVAVAAGVSHDRYVLAGGRELAIDARWTGTMVRRDGKWLVAGFHYSANVFRNPILEGQRKVMLMAAGGVCAALMLIAFFAGRKSVK